ncbi:hypothetical protein TcasGA2_TC002707 [Tribolium castaneum]|uniref:Uncharacterized protein n=1 Tax=Tribolium castaneum TaxID=7070 RepID=D6WDV0_TRICA|nr:hypothetical protein TcasGA2_TC002707 [Tribolium castaneum]
MTSFRKMSGTCKTQDVWYWRSRIHALIIPDMSVRNNGKVIVDRSSERAGKGDSGVVANKAVDEERVATLGHEGDSFWKNFTYH